MIKSAVFSVMNKKLLILALIFGFLAIIIGNYYLTNLETRYRATGKLVQVIVARKYIPAGTLLTENIVDVFQIPEQFVQPGVMLSGTVLKNPAGAYIYSTVVPISKGEQVMFTKLTLKGTSTGLALNIPAGYRAISFPVDEVSSVAELIRPGDFVDILTIYNYTAGGKERAKTSTLFQKVLVLAVGKQFVGRKPVIKSDNSQQISSSDSDTGGYSSITLSLTPTDAQILLLASSRAELTFVLRPYGDEEVLELPETDISVLIKDQNIVLVPTVKPQTPTVIRGIQQQLQQQLGQ